MRFGGGGTGGNRSLITCRIDSTNNDRRKQALDALLAEVGPYLKWQDRGRLRCILLENHHAFAVEEGERGETDLIQMYIDTNNAIPR